MNKRELAEVKKHFHTDDGLFTVGGVATAYINAEKKIKGCTVRNFIEIPEDEGSLLFNIAKRTLSGSIGKNLVEYAFPREQYESGGVQELLYGILKDKSLTGDYIDSLLPLTAASLHMESTYAVLVMHCTYSVISKSKDDRSLDMNDLDYNFFIVSFIPVAMPEKELIFDGEAIIKREDLILTLSDKPSDGFLFPVFSDRAPDVNSVLVYSKNAAKPNISLVTELLGCEFVRNPKSEREVFNEVLKTAVGDELDYTKIIQIDEMIASYIAENQNETELPTVDAPRIARMLSEAGVSESARAALPAAFEKAAGETPLLAVNLVSSKVNLQTEGITVSITGDSAGKLRTVNQNGRKCLIIDLDDPTVIVNGIETTV
ncbi:MAG: DUF4317 domain-containing protein [Ruminococcus sp.]|jgi:hypothetical protein|nr:DUF4317 domain-containing protein [Ruminococcus sp.]